MKEEKNRDKKNRDQEFNLILSDIKYFEIFFQKRFHRIFHFEAAGRPEAPLLYFSCIRTLGITVPARVKTSLD